MLISAPVVFLTMIRGSRPPNLVPDLVDFGRLLAGVESSTPGEAQVLRRILRPVQPCAAGVRHLASGAES